MWWREERHGGGEGDESILNPTAGGGHEPTGCPVCDGSETTEDSSKGPPAPLVLLLSIGGSLQEPLPSRDRC